MVYKKERQDRDGWMDVAMAMTLESYQSTGTCSVMLQQTKEFL